MEYNQKLVDEVFNEFNEYKDVPSLLKSYADQLKPITEEYKIESQIPSDHIYWDIRSKILITQMLYRNEMLPKPEPPLNAKQSYRMLKYGRGHKFNRNIK